MSSNGDWPLSGAACSSSSDVDLAAPVVVVDKKAAAAAAPKPNEAAWDWPLSGGDSDDERRLRPMQRAPPTSPVIRPDSFGSRVDFVLALCRGCSRERAEATLRRHPNVPDAVCEIDRQDKLMARAMKRVTTNA